MRPFRPGFTLVEVLIVIVILGILTAIAIPKYTATKQRAYFAVMRSDLRNLATAQEAYFQVAGQYYDGPVPPPGSEVNLSPGVTVVLSDVTAAGWAATATHASAPGRMCAMYYGAASPVPPAQEPGAVACR